MDRERCNDGDLLAARSTAGGPAHSMVSALWVWRSGTGVLHLSPDARRLCGLPGAGGRLGLRDALRLCRGLSRRRLLGAVRRGLASREGWVVNLVPDNVAEPPRFVRCHAEPILEDGRLAGYVGSLQWQGDMEARDSRAATGAGLPSRWRLAVVGSGLALWDWDLSADEVYCAPEWRQLVGCGDKTRQSQAEWRRRVHPHDAAQRDDALYKHIQGYTRLYVCEYRLRHGGGRYVWVRERGTVVERDAQDHAVRMVGTLEDVDGDRRTVEALRQSERRFHQTFNHAPIGFALVEPDGRRVAVNREFCRMLGYDETTLMRLSFEAITHPEDQSMEREMSRQLLAGERHHASFRKRYLHASGSVVHAQVNVTLLRDESDQPVHFIAQVQDITERERQADALFDANELAEVTLAALGDGILRCDRAGVIQYCNAAAAALANRVPESLVGQPFQRVFVLRESAADRRIEDPVARVMSTGARLTLPESVRLRQADDGWLPVTFSAAPLRDREECIVGAVLVLRDVSEERRMTQALAYQARHDDLTGLLNRRAFEEALADAWGKARTADRAGYLMFLDLDHFATVNDTCGHLAGDELLCDIAGLLQGSLKAEDFLARLGGDEFAAILAVRSESIAAAIAERLIRVVRNHQFVFQGRTYSVGLSVGIAPIAGAVKDPSTLLSHADTALYVAKEAGRGRYHCYRPDDRQVQFVWDSLDTAQRIQTALEQNRFELHLQSIVDGEGAVRGYEALLRLRDETGRLVPPINFLPAAKRLGLMARIDEWVVRTAIGLVDGGWPQDRYIAVNLSARSIGDPLFGDRLLKLLARAGNPTHALRFEITESEQLGDGVSARLPDALRELGFRVWLDDFGTGYNSFDLIKRLSVDGIKIDAMFTRGLETDSIDRVFVQAIVQMARQLELEMVAEGIETVATLDMLKGLGVNRFQGFLFHRAQAPADALRHRCMPCTAERGWRPGTSGG